MKPIYFPFTTISGPVFTALSACFKEVVLYHPSRHHVPDPLRRWEESGRLEIRLPVEDEYDPLPELLKSYHAWADLHGEERLRLEKIYPSRTPFLSDTTVSRIRSDIQKTMTNADEIRSEAEKERSNLLRARLVLTIAQEYDKYRDGFSDDLRKIDHMEKNLFRNLISDPDDPFQKGASDDFAEGLESGHPIPDERLAAWVCLYLHHRMSVKTETAAKTPNLFITSDSSVMDMLLMQAGGVDLLCRISGIPLGPGTIESAVVSCNPKIYETLEQRINHRSRSSDLEVSFSDAGNDAGNTGLLTIYSVKGDVMAAFSGGSSTFSEMFIPFQAATEVPRTLLGTIKKHPVP